MLWHHPERFRTFVGEMGALGNPDSRNAKGKRSIHETASVSRSQSETDSTVVAGPQGTIGGMSALLASAIGNTLGRSRIALQGSKIVACLCTCSTSASGRKCNLDYFMRLSVACLGFVLACEHGLAGP